MDQLFAGWQGKCRRSQLTEGTKIHRGGLGKTTTKHRPRSSHPDAPKTRFYGNGDFIAHRGALRILRIAWQSQSLLRNSWRPSWDAPPGWWRCWSQKLMEWLSNCMVNGERPFFSVDPYALKRATRGNVLIDCARFIVIAGRSVIVITLCLGVNVPLINPS